VTEDVQERSIATDHFRSTADFSRSWRPRIVFTEELLVALLLPTQPSVNKERGSSGGWGVWVGGASSSARRFPSARVDAPMPSRWEGGAALLGLRPPRRCRLLVCRGATVGGRV